MDGGMDGLMYVCVHICRMGGWRDGLMYVCMYTCTRKIHRIHDATDCPLGYSKLSIHYGHHHESKH